MWQRNRRVWFLAIGALVAAPIILWVSGAGSHEQSAKHGFNIAAAQSVRPQRVVPFETIALEQKIVDWNADEPSSTTRGPLHFAGALALTSKDARFGGLSGIEVDENGRLIGVSDRGFWFEAQIKLDAMGRLAGLSNTGIGFIRDAAGEPLEKLDEQDAEDLAWLPNGLIAVSFERHHRIATYDIRRFGPGAHAQNEIAFAPSRFLQQNRSLEALSFDSSGNYLAMSEQLWGRAGVWHVAADALEALGADAQIATPIGTAITALDALPGGEGLPPGFVGVTRKLNWPRGGFESTIFFLHTDAMALKPHASPTSKSAQPPTIGPMQILADWQSPYLSANFEAISAVRSPLASANGNGLRLYLFNDNNYHEADATFLLAFDWFPEP